MPSAAMKMTAAQAAKRSKDGADWIGPAMTAVQAAKRTSGPRVRQDRTMTALQAAIE